MHWLVSKDSGKNLMKFEMRSGGEAIAVTQFVSCPIQHLKKKTQNNPKAESSDYRM